MLFYLSYYSVFAVNNLFLSARFGELKNYELNQYEYIPTLNGQCIYETKEIATWVKKTTIDTFEIVLNRNRFLILNVLEKFLVHRFYKITK